MPGINNLLLASSGFVERSAGWKGEAAMAGGAYLILAVFLIGVALGVVYVVAMAIHGERACVPDSQGWGASRPGIHRTPVLGCCAVQVHVSRMSFAPLTGTATALRRVRVSPM
jgi:hypothetical protein